MTKYIKYLLLLLLLFPALSYGQVIIVGDGEIVAVGVTKIFLSGDWTNNSSGAGYTASNTSRVYFNSANPQSISGSTITNFTSIQIRNTGANGFQLNNDIKVIDTLSLDRGIIHTNSHTVFFEGDGDSEGAAINRFIDGLIIRTGTGNFRFDVGKGGKYAPLWAYGLSGQTGSISTEYFYKSTPPNNTSVSSPLVKVSDVEYWHMNSTLSARVRLYWKDGAESGIKSIDPDSLKLAIYNGSNWVEEAAAIYASASVTSGYISTDNNISLSSLDVTFGSTNNIANPLPIELLSFTAQCQKQDVIIEWSTVSEENNNYFTLLRSEDAEHYEEIAQILGAGNSNEVLNYSYQDWNAASGQYYYMLKQTDFDGKNETFTPVFVSCKETKEVSLKILYDANQVYALLSNAESGSRYNMMIIDHTGRIVVQETQRVNAQNFYRIPYEQLASGLYSIIYFTDDGSERLNQKVFIK